MRHQLGGNFAEGFARLGIPVSLAESIDFNAFGIGKGIWHDAEHAEQKKYQSVFYFHGQSIATRIRTVLIQCEHVESTRYKNSRSGTDQF